MSDYHNILFELQKYISSRDITIIDLPIGIKFSSNGNIYIIYSRSYPVKCENIKSAFNHISEFLNEHKN